MHVYTVYCVHAGKPLVSGVVLGGLELCTWEVGSSARLWSSGRSGCCGVLDILEEFVRHWEVWSSGKLWSSERSGGSGRHCEALGGLELWEALEGIVRLWEVWRSGALRGLEP